MRVVPLRLHALRGLVLTPSEKGAIAEAAITAAAVKLGIVVLRPVVEGRRYDLVFDIDHELMRIQCKSGALKGDVIVAYTGTSRHTPGGYLRTTYGPREIDAFAIYVPELYSCYLLPIAEFAGRHVVHLRLAPARNNQLRGVTMAADYTLGAIAQLGERRRGTAEAVGSSPTSSIAEIPHGTRRMG